MGVTEILVEYAIRIIDAIGYVGVFLLMTLESMVAPIPSEAVMPFAGFLISDGTLSWVGVLLVSSAGSLAGSVLSYYIGKYLGNAFVVRYGKYLLLNEEHLLATNAFFAKHGTWSVFACRFIPVVRHFISIPAGIANMNIGAFVLYTLVGATAWNMFLAYVGFALRDNWTTIQQYTHVLDILVVLGIVGVGIYFVYSQLRKK